MALDVLVFVTTLIKYEENEFMNEQKDQFEELKKLRDEIRVRMHLGEMDVREWWGNVEPRLIEVEESISRSVGRASESTDVFVEEFVSAFRRIRDRLDKGPGE